MLWTGQFFTTLGTYMHAAALAWQVYELTGSPLYLGILGLVRGVTLMGMSLVGGAQADSRDRRSILLFTQTFLLLLSAGLAMATAMEVVNVTFLFGVAALMAAVSAFDSPARQALIPALVPQHQLMPAMSLNILALSIARMVGPAIGGIAIAAIGLSGTYALGAFAFLGTIFAVLLIGKTTTPAVVTLGGVAAVAEGLRFVRATPVIWGIMLLDFIATILGSTIGLAPVFAEDVLRVGPEGLGLLLAAPAAGSVIGGMFVSLVPSITRPGHIIIASVIAYGLSLALFGLAPTLWVALIALGFAGAANSISVAMRHTVRNLATPDELRGRVAASHSALAGGGPRLGEFQAGITAALIGPRPAMVLGGLGCVLAAAVIARAVPAVTSYRLPQMDREPAPPEEAPRSTMPRNR